MIRSSQCHNTARDKTRRSTSGAKPHQILHICRWSTGTTSCSMMGPLSRSGHIVGGGADEFHPALLGLLIRLRPEKAGRNEWWMLMIGRPTSPKEPRGEHLHVSSEHHQIHVTA